MRMKKNIAVLILLLLCTWVSGCTQSQAPETAVPDATRLEQFLGKMLTAPASKVASALQTVKSDEDLAAFSDAVIAFLGDDVAEEAKDSFVANRINPLQSHLMTSTEEISTVPTSITLSEPFESGDQERCYPYEAQLTVTTPDGVYENCSVSGQLRVDQNGKVLSITMDFSDSLRSALGIDALVQ